MFRSSNAAKSVRQVRPLCCSMSFDARELKPSCKRLALRQVARMGADMTYPRFASQRAGQHAIRRADADGHPHPHQYPALGFCVAGLPDLARLAIAAAKNAADLANADRAPGVFSEGRGAARHGTRYAYRALVRSPA